MPAVDLGSLAGLPLWRYFWQAIVLLRRWINQPFFAVSAYCQCLYGSFLCISASIIFALITQNQTCALQSPSTFRRPLPISGALTARRTTLITGICGFSTPDNTLADGYKLSPCKFTPLLRCTIQMPLPSARGKFPAQPFRHAYRNSDRLSPARQTRHHQRRPAIDRDRRCHGVVIGACRSRSASCWRFDFIIVKSPGYAVSSLVPLPRSISGDVNSPRYSHFDRYCGREYFPCWRNTVSGISNS